ncbi:MAG: DUF4421 family protein [Prevotella sp.]|nr:DUF4421 family protein [Prevotella sp.]
MKQKKLWMIAAILIICGTASAQNSNTSFIKKVGTLLDSMSVKGVDRRYIDAPKNPWQIILKGNVNQSSLKMHSKGTLSVEAEDDIYISVPYSATPSLKTEPSRYVGIWAGYRGYGLGYTVNVGGDKGSYLTFGATGGAYGINVRFHSFENSHPDFNLNSSLIPEGSEDDWQDVKLIDPIKIRTIIADGYYLFNGKHFSYAAAYDQSVIQKRSAGSLMVGGMYYYGSIRYDTDTNGDLVYIMHGLGKIKLWQGSVGVGYAYNWVPIKGLLVNAMAMPMLTFVNRIKAYGYSTNVPELMNESEFLDEEMTDEEWDDWFYGKVHITPMGNKTFNSGVTVNFDARLSVTYNFGRYFVGAYGQYNNFRYRHADSRGHLDDWFVNASFGIRL